MAVRLIFDRSAQVLAMLERRIEDVLETGARITQEAAVRAITTGGRSGRVYIHRGHLHQASARGEAPANETGELAGSIVILRPSRTKRAVRVGAPYGAVLELRKGRPFLLPAFRSSIGPMRQRLRQIQSSVGWRGGRPLRRVLHYRSTVKPRSRR